MTISVLLPNDQAWNEAGEYGEWTNRVQEGQSLIDQSACAARFGTGGIRVETFADDERAYLEKTLSVEVGPGETAYLAAWIRPETYPSAETHCLVLGSNDAWVSVDAAGAWRVGVAEDGGSQVVSTESATLAVQEWRYVVLAVKRSSNAMANGIARFYVDGQLVANMEGLATSDRMEDVECIQVGAAAAAGGVFHLDVDDVYASVAEYPMPRDAAGASEIIARQMPFRRNAARTGPEDGAFDIVSQLTEASGYALRLQFDENANSSGVRNTNQFLSRIQVGQLRSARFSPTVTPSQPTFSGGGWYWASVGSGWRSHLVRATSTKTLTYAPVGTAEDACDKIVVYWENPNDNRAAMVVELLDAAGEWSGAGVVNQGDYPKKKPCREALDVPPGAAKPYVVRIRNEAADGSWLTVQGWVLLDSMGVGAEGEEAWPYPMYDLKIPEDMPQYVFRLAPTGLPHKWVGGQHSGDTGDCDQLVTSWSVSVDGMTWTPDSEDARWCGQVEFSQTSVAYYDAATPELAEISETVEVSNGLVVSDVEVNALVNMDGRQLYVGLWRVGSGGTQLADVSISTETNVYSPLVEGDVRPLEGGQATVETYGHSGWGSRLDNIHGTASGDGVWLWRDGQGHRKVYCTAESFENAPPGYAFSGGWNMRPVRFPSIRGRKSIIDSLFDSSGSPLRVEYAALSCVAGTTITGGQAYGGGVVNVRLGNLGVLQDGPAGYSVVNTIYELPPGPGVGLVNCLPESSAGLGPDGVPLWDSPAVDGGVDLGQSVDMDGRPVYGLPDIGPLEYQPPWVMGQDAMSAPGSVRVYADGRFRDLTAGGPDAADLSVSPADGWAAFEEDDRRPWWMDIEVQEWSGGPGEVRRWVITAGADAGGVAHEVGGLTPGVNYNLFADGQWGCDIEGDQVCGGVIRADAEGRIAFVYTGECQAAALEVAPATYCDFNGDGCADVSDLDLLLAEVHDGGNRWAFDITGDGQVNQADSSFVVHNVLGIEFGDANMDGVVNVNDLSSLAANWHQGRQPGWRGGDFNGDGLVDVNDLAVLADSWTG